ncbi:hypothetical protein AVEN_252156-1 [Araneus ventricosus]|uniref:Tc1-like transposase DDE domain-containing protein n=1 Tax=Araneus ventricosus TaxID=182803 RepID=A0A4Y2FPX7_ARAVE|nr:hypothetical protein AVEN_252156-1 [Araneus ventricosus]
MCLLDLLRPKQSRLNKFEGPGYSNLAPHQNRNYEGRSENKSKYNIFGSDGRIMVWRRKNEELNPKNLVGTVKYGCRGVLVLGYMSASGLDNDPMHTALKVCLWCLYNCPQNLKTPPQLPDLNPIEHIWGELEVRVRKRDIKTKSELKTVMMEEWMNIDAEITKKTSEICSKTLKSCCGY